MEVDNAGKAPWSRRSIAATRRQDYGEDHCHFDMNNLADAAATIDDMMASPEAGGAPAAGRWRIHAATTFFKSRSPCQPIRRAQGLAWYCAIRQAHDA